MSRVPPIPALTAIRGLAAWWVVIYHFREALPAGTPAWLQGVLAHGYLAVDLFFILSGFVLSLNYGHQFAAGLRGSLRFYGLRLARIYPLHLVVLLLFLSVPLAILLFSSQGQAEGYDAGYYLLSLALVQNWGFAEPLRWNVPAWSISTEFFAYLFFPLLAWAATRWLRGLAAALATIALLLLALGVLFAQFGEGSLGGAIERLGLPRCLLEFAIGIALHRAWLARRGRPRWETEAASLLAVLCFAGAALGLAPDYVLLPAGCCALIHALLDDRALLAWALRGRLLQWLGLVSYSTYLVHYLVKAWVKFLLINPALPGWLPLPAYVAATLLASWILFHLVELPGQRWGRALVLGRRAPTETSPSLLNETAARPATERGTA